MSDERFLDPIFVPLEATDVVEDIDPIRVVVDFQARGGCPVSGVSLSYTNRRMGKHPIVVTNLLKPEDLNFSAGQYLNAAEVQDSPKSAGPIRRHREIEIHRRTAQTDAWRPFEARLGPADLDLAGRVLYERDHWVAIMWRTANEVALVVTGHRNFSPTDLALRPISSWDDYSAGGRLPWQRTWK